MKENRLKELTRAEEEVMMVVWKLKKAFVKDMLGHLPGQPAYNTVSTVVRILEDKGFVAHTAYGKSHEYHAIVPKSTYSNFKLQNLTKGYFSNSFKNLLSFMAEEENLSLKDIEEIQEKLKKMKS